MSWICMRCAKPVPNPYDRIEKRLDYRKPASKSGRWKNPTVANYCLDCAKVDLEEELERHKEQMRLLPGGAGRRELDGQISWV